MRLRSTSVKLVVAVAATASGLVASSSVAVAQVIVNPTDQPERNDGGWIYWIAIAMVVLGVLIAISIVLRYLRYAPRFQREEGTTRTVRAPRIQAGREAPRRPVNITGAPVVVPAPAVAVAAAPVAVAPAPAAAPAAAAVASAPPAASPTPASAPTATAPGDGGADGAAPEGAASAASPVAAEPAAAPPAPAGERKEVPIDQETFDRVLAELLEKGTTRRVAEGQARRAAMIAARKKAGA